MEQLSKLFPPWPSPFIAVFDAFDTITTTLAVPVECIILCIRLLSLRVLIPCNCPRDGCHFVLFHSGVICYLF